MFAKLFARITESSLMEEDIPVRYTFVMLIAIADPLGYVIGTDVAIARRLNMPLQEFERCRDVLMTADIDSNSKEEDGRRIVESDGERGYRVVNYVKYRDMRDEEDRRAYMREYMRRKRSGEPTVVNSVNTCKQKLTLLAKAEAEAEAEATEQVRVHVERCPQTASEKCNAPVMHPPLHPASASVHECTSEKDKGCGEKEERNFVTDVRNLGDRLGALFGREVGSFLGYCEETGLRDLLKRPKIKSEVKEIVGWFAKSPRYKPQSLCSLLERWDSSLDRARNYDKNLKDNAENKPPSKTMSDRMMDDITRVSKL